MLLAVDVGNTQTVIGLYSLDAEGRSNKRGADTDQVDPAFNLFAAAFLFARAHG